MGSFIDKGNVSRANQARVDGAQWHYVTSLLGYLLARTVFLQAQQAHAPYASMEALLDALDRVRRVTVARSASGGKGRLHVTTQLEDVDPTVAPVLAALGVTDALVYTPGS